MSLDFFISRKIIFLSFFFSLGIFRAHALDPNYYIPPYYTENETLDEVADQNFHKGYSKSKDEAFKKSYRDSLEHWNPALNIDKLEDHDGYLHTYRPPSPYVVEDVIDPLDPASPYNLKNARPTKKDVFVVNLSPVLNQFDVTMRAVSSPNFVLQESGQSIHLNLGYHVKFHHRWWWEFGGGFLYAKKMKIQLGGTDKSETYDLSTALNGSVGLAFRRSWFGVNFGGQYREITFLGTYSATPITAATVLQNLQNIRVKTYSPYGELQVLPKIFPQRTRLRFGGAQSLMSSMAPGYTVEEGKPSVREVWAGFGQDFAEDVGIDLVARQTTWTSPMNFDGMTYLLQMNFLTVL